jgi:histidinol-phosphate aminotransferase
VTTTPRLRWLRPNVDALQAYVPGEQPQEPGWVKLNTNENPHVLPQIVSAVAAAATSAIRTYPDPICSELRRAIGERYGLPPEWVLCANGSDELLTLAVRAAAGEGDRIAYPDPSYTLYETLAQIQNAFPIPVPLGPEWELPVSDLAAAGASLTFVANPNAPTGTPYALPELEALAEAVPGLLVIDEAYVDFGGQTALPLLQRHERLVILRTMSKAFGLAGVRLGYAFGAPDTISALRKVQDSYPVDRLAQVAGIAAMAHYHTALASCAQIAARRDRYAALIRERFGWHVWPSATNFLLVRTAPLPAPEVHEALRRRRVLVRYFARPRLEGCLRISVGTEEEMEALVGALGEVVE